MIDARRLDHRTLGILLGALLIAAALVLAGTGSATGQEAGDGEIPVTMTEDRNQMRTCEMYLLYGKGDDGCSLREAVLVANDDADYDTVLLQGETYKLSIPGAGEDDGWTGDLDVHADLTILGAGSAETTIEAAWEFDEGDVSAQDEHDAPAPDRLLHVHGATSLTLQGLTLTDGAVTDGDPDTEECGSDFDCSGGAIYLDGTSQDDVVAADNDNADAIGLTAIDVVIRDSYAEEAGGGIAAVAHDDGPAASVVLELTDSTVVENLAAEVGGGIFVNAPTVSVLATDSHLVDNQGQFAGGGMFVEGARQQVGIGDDLNGDLRAAEAQQAHVRFEGGTVQGNQASQGGGIAAFGPDVHLGGTEVTGNAAHQGAGLYHDGPSLVFTDGEGDEVQPPTVHLDGDARFHDNEASWLGGAMALWSAELQANDVTLDENRADAAGAVLVDGGDVELTRVEVHHNTGWYGTGGLVVRGGLATPPGLIGGDVAIVDSTFTGNEGGWDGAGAVQLGTDPYFYGDSLDGFEADDRAQPQYEYDEHYELWIEGTTFADNTGGTGMLVAGDDEAAPQREWVSYSAGALWSVDGYHGEIVNSTFSGNETAGAGAGVRVDELDAGDLALTHVTFADHGLVEDGVILLENGDDERGAAIHLADSYRDDQGELRLSHVVLAGGDANCGGDLERLASSGHNLDDDGSCGLDADGDVQADAQLGPLADNGGVTLTHLPDVDSPAVAGGQTGPCELDVDQRGMARPQGDACDIGAVEVEQVPEEPVVPDPDRPFGCDPDAADRFSDVPRPYVHRDAIGCLADLGFVVGFTDGTYGPNLDMSRGQFATVVTRMIEFIADEELDDDGPAFPDVPDQHVHAEGINKLAAAGLIRGFEDGNFRPGASLERGQAASILDAAITLATGQQLPDGPDAFLDDDGSPHEDALNRLAQEGIVLGFGDGMVRPNDEIKRGQLASMVVRTLVTIEGLIVGAE